MEIFLIGKGFPNFINLAEIVLLGKHWGWYAFTFKIAELVKIISFEKSGEITSNPIRDYGKESYTHYHEFIDSCLGKGKCSAPFSYSARLTETILLGVIAGRFPNKTLHWDNTTAKFLEQKANNFINSPYREF